MYHSLLLLLFFFLSHTHTTFYSVENLRKSHSNIFHSFPMFLKVNPLIPLWVRGGGETRKNNKCFVSFNVNNFLRPVHFLQCTTEGMTSKLIPFFLIIRIHSIWTLLFCFCYIDQVTAGAIRHTHAHNKMKYIQTKQRRKHKRKKNKQNNRPIIIKNAL